MPLGGGQESTTIRTEATPCSRTMAAKLAVFRGLDSVVLTAECDEPVNEHPKKTFPFIRGSYEGIAHHAVGHLSASLREVGVAADVGSELEPPVILHCPRGVDQMRPHMKLQTRLPLSSVADTPRIGLAPGQQLIRCHSPVR